MEAMGELAKTYEPAATLLKELKQALILMKHHSELIDMRAGRWPWTSEAMNKIDREERKVWKMLYDIKATGGAMAAGVSSYLYMHSWIQTHQFANYSTYVEDCEK